MAIKSVLVTGGAGFIGSHVVDLLLEKGYKVRILDKLVDQVHENKTNKYIPEKAELIVGDICDKKIVEEALKDMDAVINLAAEVGVGQSMYEITRYMNTNTGGTAVMLELLASGKYDIKRMVVASSMSVYGEGMYECQSDGIISPPLRSESQLKNRIWEVLCPKCQKVLKPIPTTEDKPLDPASIYAISKLDQELMTLSVGRAYDISSIALRFFNTYGTRQSLSNPYTGVAAIFSSRLLNNETPLVFEDGEQARDFVHVSDVAAAVVMALEKVEVKDVVCNIGSGQPVTVNEVAIKLAKKLGVNIEPNIMHNYRVGDIRHCWADTSRTKELLGFEAKISFDEGLDDLIEWVKDEPAIDRGAQAQSELNTRGLTL